MKVVRYNPFWNIEFFVFARNKAMRHAQAMNKKPVRFAAQRISGMDYDGDEYEYSPIVRYVGF